MAQKILKAIHEGGWEVGDVTIQCAVLEDGTRVVSQRSLYKALGRSERTGGVTAKGGAQQLPRIVAAKNLLPFVSDELRSALIPIKYHPMHGGRTAYGHRGDAIPDICNVYLDARSKGVLKASQLDHAEHCEILVRSFAKVGVIAIIDEVTGYQDYRTKKALQELLEKYIAKELQPWVKTFQDDFYKEIFRLRNWPYRPDSVKRPQVIGRWTNDIVYDRLAPGVREELHRLAERDENGRPRHRLFQRLTQEGGHPKLREHLASVTTLMRASANWDQFRRLLNRSLPAVGSNLELPLSDDD